MVPYIGGLQGNLRIDSTRARIDVLWRNHGPTLSDDIEHGSYRELVCERPRSIGARDRDTAGAAVVGLQVTTYLVCVRI